MINSQCLLCGIKCNNNDITFYVYNFTAVDIEEGLYDT
jgi:hypothetical protein